MQSFSSPRVLVMQGAVGIPSFLGDFDEPHTLFLVSPSFQQQISFSPTKGALSHGYGIAQDVLDDELTRLKDTQRIVVVGASKLIDQAKYLAAKLDVPVLAIPTLLSTNAFSTERSVLRVRDVPTSLETKAPDTAYIITSVLDLAPMRLHRFGLLDVLSIYTALRDWDMAIAAKETTSAVEYPLARAILDAYLSLPVERDYTYVEIAKLLLHSGFVVSMYGDGRPESGSEHIIAKVVERNVECLHAHSVALGILVSMQLQGSWSDDIAARAKHIPDWETPRGATVLAQIEERISSASIKARPGRYTVLDTSSPNEIDRAISRALLFLRS